MNSHRNYFTMEKVSPDDLEKIDRAHNKMIELGILHKDMDPKNLELDEMDQRYTYTDEFDYHITESFRTIFWHVDSTNNLKKFANPKTAKKAKKRKEEFDNLRKKWVQDGGSPDNFNEWYEIETLVDIILKFKVITTITRRLHEDGPSNTEPIKIPTKDVERLVEVEHEMLKEQGNDEYETMAQLIYGVSKYRRESKADRLLANKLVHYEIMTDTGHLTRFFMDVLRQHSEVLNITMEQLAEDKDALFVLVVEMTREEDFENADEYLSKKSQIEITEYNEMARIVGKCLLMEIVKAKEGVK